MGSDSSAYLRNVGTATSPSFVRFYKNSAENPIGGWYNTSTLVPSPEFWDLDNDGDLDLLFCDDSGYVKSLENIGTATSPDFGSLEVKNPPAILDDLDFGQFPSMDIEDVTNDGIPDIIVSPFTPTVFYWFKGVKQADMIATGIIESSFSKTIQLYPNPTSGSIQIDLGEESELVQVNIRDISGSLIQQELFLNSKKMKLDMNGSQGVYFVEIISKQNKEVIKVVKK